MHKGVAQLCICSLYVLIVACASTRARRFPVRPWWLCPHRNRAGAHPLARFAAGSGSEMMKAVSDGKVLDDKNYDFESMQRSLSCCGQGCQEAV